MGKDARLIRILVGCLLLGAIWWGTMQRLAVSKLSAQHDALALRVDTLQDQAELMNMYREDLRLKLATAGFAALPPLPTDEREDDVDTSAKEKDHM